MRIFLKLMKIRCYNCCINIELIDLTKSNRSKECMICHYWSFNHGFKFQDSACDGCHDFTIYDLI